MRRSTIGLVMAAALMASPALAQDKEGSSSGGGSALRQSGGLLDRGTHKRPMMISFFAGFPHAYWYYSGFPFGIGGRFLIPLVHDGFIPSVNDEFSLEFGADFAGVAAGAFYGIFSIPVEVMWRFHMIENLSLYAKLGAALEFGVTGYYCYYGRCNTGVGVGVQPIGNVGLIYMVNKTIALRAEAGYPWVKFGIGFAL